VHSTFADAQAELAATYFNQILLGSLAPIVGSEQARRAATNALKLDPKNVVANVAMAEFYMWYDWDWASAERILKQMATIAPSSAEVLYAESDLSFALGHLDEASKQLKRVLAQDPLNTYTLNFLSYTQFNRGQLTEAEASARRLLDIRPNFSTGHEVLGFILLERGDRNGALVEMQKEQDEETKRAGLAMVYYALGRKADSEAALTGMINNQGDADAVGIAEVYAYRGQADDAFRMLERAYAQKDPYLYELKGDSFFKSLRSDSRYKALLRKMNLPE